MPFYLQFSTDIEGPYERFTTKKDAAQRFADVALDLARFEQRIEATIHIAPRRSEIVEYPDYFCRLGPRGGVRVEKA